MSKGQLSRMRLLTQAREVMNDNGIHITLRQLAILMDVRVSSITNHFPTREQMLREGMLEPGILQPELFQTVQFQLVNLFTTWLLSLSLYDSRTGYRKMKPLYLNGIIYLLRPYLTPAAEDTLASIDFRAIAGKGTIRTVSPVSRN